MKKFLMLLIKFIFSLNDEGNSTNNDLATNAKKLDLIIDDSKEIEELKQISQFSKSNINRI